MRWKWDGVHFLASQLGSLAAWKSVVIFFSTLQIQIQVRGFWRISPLHSSGGTTVLGQQTCEMCDRLPVCDLQPAGDAVSSGFG